MTGGTLIGSLASVCGDRAARASGGVLIGKPKADRLNVRLLPRAESMSKRKPAAVGLTAQSGRNHADVVRQGVTMHEDRG